MSFFPAQPSDKKAIEEGAAFMPRFDASGLITAVVTDARDGELLMVAHMNEEALRLTLGRPAIQAAAPASIGRLLPRTAIYRWLLKALAITSINLGQKDVMARI